VPSTKYVLTSGTLHNKYAARQRAIVQFIATKLELHNREIVVRFPIKNIESYPLSKSVETSSGGHPATVNGQWDALSPAVKPPEHEADH